MLVYFFEIRRLAPPLNQFSQLEEMLALRKMGASYLDLQIKYNVSKDTIVYLCRRFGLGGKMQPPITKSHKYNKKGMAVSTTRINAPTFYTEEVINEGKTYQEYLQEAKNRKPIIR